METPDKCTHTQERHTEQSIWEPYRRAIHTLLKEEKVRETSVFEFVRVQYTHTHTHTRTGTESVRGLNRTERADFYSVLFSISFELDVIFFCGSSREIFGSLFAQETSKRIKKIVNFFYHLIEQKMTNCMFEHEID